MNRFVEGFSKRTKDQKIQWLAENYFENPEKAKNLLRQYWNQDTRLQRLHDEFIENTITNYYLPFGIAPNFLINGHVYAIPMAIEESSVVAAACKAAKFWQERGGFTAEVISTEKIGQVHFMFKGASEKLIIFFEYVKPLLKKALAPLTANMEKRGGGLLDIQLRNKTDKIQGYYQLHCTFETLDAMGANFINSCLEQLAKTLVNEASSYNGFLEKERNIEVVMSILSNYVPDCLVRASVSCDIDQLNEDESVTPREFADKFVQAVNIACHEPYRAVTHNKGIMNGIDAVILATGNDFRAVEAGVHAYAARNGAYSSLTKACTENGRFTFSIEIPLALGTVGGLTQLHPLVKLALEMLGNPGAKTLMQIVAVAGLAQNFAAIRSLITTGIQKGHMKMHLFNILNQLEATEEEKTYFVNFFKDKTVSHSLVVNEFNRIRQKA
ncbi:hydroxymethylglutaryl-CoA reductase, degradative [Ascidiimonas aurantiaca]|uniref:hydroxymethylglutaryl-CoA reductase, degradative n=1 Tax=Ascidiimonas aurantiaca TaxID=1685432 RepID=UPI0030EF0B74